MTAGVPNTATDAAPSGCRIVDSRTEISGMHETKRPEFDQPRANLRRTNQSGSGDCRRRAGTRDLEHVRQMCRHRARNETGCSEHKGQNRHRSTRRRRRLALDLRALLRRRRGDEQPIER